MDTKQLRIHVQMLEAALDHAALVAELGREASEGSPVAAQFDAVRKMVRDFRHRHPAIANMWLISLGMETMASGTMQGGEAELHNLPKREPPRGLMSVLDMSPEQVARAEWRGVGETLKQAQDRLQADGSRQTWLDWAIAVCRERGKEPAPPTRACTRCGAAFPTLLAMNAHRSRCTGRSDPPPAPLPQTPPRMGKPI